MVYYVDLQGLPEDGPRGLLSPVCIVDKFEADYEVSVPDSVAVLSRGGSCARRWSSQGRYIAFRQDEPYDEAKDFILIL